MVSTVHAYTGSQALVDVSAKGRRGRAAALNIVPTDPPAPPRRSASCCAAWPARWTAWPTASRCPTAR
ncbi:MAG: hypothetical protein U0470_09455 [Anaerolineae bacterium]